MAFRTDKEVQSIKEKIAKLQGLLVNKAQDLRRNADFGAKAVAVADELKCILINLPDPKYLAAKVSVTRTFEEDTIRRPRRRRPQKRYQHVSEFLRTVVRMDFDFEDYLHTPGLKKKKTVTIPLDPPLRPGDPERRFKAAVDVETIVPGKLDSPRNWWQRVKLCWLQIFKKGSSYEDFDISLQPTREVVVVEKPAKLDSLGRSFASTLERIEAETYDIETFIDAWTKEADELSVKSKSLVKRTDRLDTKVKTLPQISDDYIKNLDNIYNKITKWKNDVPNRQKLLFQYTQNIERIEKQVDILVPMDLSE